MTIDTLTVVETTNTPQIDFDFGTGKLTLRGESHPENAIEFYATAIERLTQYLQGDDTGPVHFDFAFVYFNSSTAKIVMMMMDLLDDCAAKGRSVTVRWEYEREDDHMEELGEEFGEDLEHAIFVMAPFDAS